MNDQENRAPLRIIAFGAHPDDCEIFAGGTAAKYAARGDEVLFVSLTNGDAGHQNDGGETLARRRAAEAQRAASVLGIQYRVLDFHDGQLQPTLEARYQVIRLIRQWRADIVFCHRPNDYHPDHRAVGILIQDSAYMVVVPNVCPDVPALRKNPFFFYVWDAYRKPYPFQVDAAVDVDGVMAKKLDMMHCHESQFYEWLPYVENSLDSVPASDSERRKWLEESWGEWLCAMTDCARGWLAERYGNAKAAAIRWAEPFELCEYGSRPSEQDWERLFPF
ncbi:MAG: PIG-L family deacetylase [Candidatus Omnitrophota bacterium]